MVGFCLDSSPKTNFRICFWEKKTWLGQGIWSLLSCTLLVCTWGQNWFLKLCRTSPLKQGVGIWGGRGKLGIFHILVLNLRQWFSQPRETVYLLSSGTGVASSCAKYLWGWEETTWSFWKSEKKIWWLKRDKINLKLLNLCCHLRLLEDSRDYSRVKKKALNLWVCNFKEAFYFWSMYLGIFVFWGRLLCVVCPSSSCGNP